MVFTPSLPPIYQIITFFAECRIQELRELPSNELKWENPKVKPDRPRSLQITRVGGPEEGLCFVFTGSFETADKFLWPLKGPLARKGAWEQWG